MPAATSAPNATTRMISVIGSENSPAFSRSSANTVSNALTALALPNSPMKSCGWACCTSSTRSTTASIFSLAVSASPRIWSSTSAA